MDKWPLGIFTSIDAGLGVQLEVARELQVETIQIHAPSKEIRTQAFAEEYLQRIAEYGITITAVFGGFEGESYADIPTVYDTVGLVPPSMRAERVKEMKEIVDFAHLLGCKVSALHLGFIPHDTSDPLYGEVIAVTQDLCDYCKEKGQSLHLETGQESAEGLLQFIGDVGRDNLFINFDPANMILYGTGEPIESLQKVGKYVRSVHCKDATWSDEPGKTWGAEVPLGQGDVGMENFLRTLDEIGYTGPLTIEREIPQEPVRQKEEIGSAVSLLKELKAKIG